MDNHLHKKVVLFLTMFVIGTTAVLIIRMAAFSIELFVLVCTYVLISFMRDYIVRVNLYRTSGTLIIYMQLVLAFVISVVSGDFFAQIYIFILIGEFAFYHSRTHSLVFTFVSYGSCILSHLIYRDFPPFEQIYFILPRGVDYLAICAISLIAKLAIQQKNQLAMDNEQLRIASIELEQKARLQERTRISRDIHDSVGHTLTSALTGLQTAEQAIAKQNYKLALDMIIRSKASVHSGLDDVRSSVHLLRENTPNDRFMPELIKLIQETAQQTGIHITYEIDPLIPELPPTIELTIYRALQEGLTNGIRHGASTHFQFALTCRDRLIRFNLTDNGKSPEIIVAGFGLNAMKERVEDVGGVLVFSSSGMTGGVQLDITIPLQTINERTG